MARQSPIRRLHQVAEAAVLTYGPASETGEAVEVVESFGELEMEYASLRKHCVLVDQPHRGVIEVSGKDRIDFLNRMVTQELKSLSPFRVKRSFWLSPKGRVDCDLRIVDLPSRTLLEMDVHAVARTLESLNKYIIAEDVTLADWTDRTHRLAMHGPTSLELLSNVAQNAHGAEASGPAFDELLPDRACVVQLFGAETVVFRDDTCGETGLELVVPVSQALKVYQQLIEAGHDRSHDEAPSEAVSMSRSGLGSRVRLRPAGWHALNIARIETGTPLYNIDFGTDSLPAETGVLKDRVSFTKGCYLGQEIVARMDARGHPKQVCVAVRFEHQTDPATGLPRQPVTGTPLAPASGGDAVGIVTSSTLSPMLGSAAIALGQVKWGHHEPGVVLKAVMDGADSLSGVVQPQLAFWSRKAGPGHSSSGGGIKGP
ncbi:MAG: aminomethyltransferase family protein [Phycisphaeraceae bacterium]|nr:aminomethyltransferase family protein [Phycisphaeraceae bacterium]